MANEEKIYAHKRHMSDHEKQSRISQMSKKLNDKPYSASCLLQEEMNDFGLANNPELMKYVEVLKSMEHQFDTLCQEYAVEYHNTIIPMVRAFKQEQEKLAQKHKQEQSRFTIHGTPVLQAKNMRDTQHIEMEKLKASQAATKHNAIEHMSKKMNACKQNIHIIFTESLWRIYQ